jgi:formylglycine-generating enzyme required for sulfatase activity
MRGTLFIFLLLASGFFIEPGEQMIKVPAGRFIPFFQKKGENISQPVKEFYMDTYAVTNEDYLQFVKANPQWTKSKVARLFADTNYLKYWIADFDIGPAYKQIKNSPVTGVSWFAANAYAKWKNKRLPTTSEWEYAASASINGKSKDALTKFILQWYEKPNPAVLPAVGSTFKNEFGLYDMHGLVWEWVYDFNQPLGGNSSTGELDKNLYCSSGSLKTADAKDYAAYMRYAFRSSLKGNYCVGNLGFRCVADIK